MRLLYVLHQNPDGYPAGIEQYLTDLLAGLIGRRFECLLVYPEGTGLRLRRYESRGQREQVYPANENRYGYSLSDPETEQSFGEIITANEPEVVHFQSLRNLPLSLIGKASDLGTRTVISVHDYFLWCINFTLLRPDFCHFERDPDACQRCLGLLGHGVPDGFAASRREYVGNLLTRCDRLIFPSRYVQSQVLSCYGHLDRSRCVVIENGIRGGYVTDRTLGRVRPSGPLRVAFLGNFLRHKGSTHFREILRHFRDRDDVEFHIFGHLYEPVDLLARNLKLHGGYDRRRIAELLRDIDVVLLLSIMPETFSYTLSEAIAAGVPVIATDLGALRERVAEEQVGFLVEYDDPVPRCCRIIEDLIANPEILDFFRRKVIEAAPRVPTFDRMVDAHVRLYETLQSSPVRA